MREMQWISGVSWTPGVDEAFGWFVRHDDGAFGPASMAAVEAAVEATRLLVWVRHGGGTTDGPRDPRMSRFTYQTPGWHRQSDGMALSHEEIWDLMGEWQRQLDR